MNLSLYYRLYLTLKNVRCIQQKIPFYDALFFKVVSSLCQLKFLSLKILSLKEHLKQKIINLKNASLFFFSFLFFFFTVKRPRKNPRLLKGYQCFRGYKVMIDKKKEIKRKIKQ